MNTLTSKKAVVLLLSQAQVTETVSKASWVLHLLKRTMNVCSIEATKKAYTALVCPLLEYAALVWSPHQQGDK